MQKQLHRMTQFRLTLLHARQEELAGADHALASAFDASLTGAPQVAAMLQNALRRVARESLATQSAVVDERRILLEQGARLKCVENITKTREAEWRADVERRKLREIVEAVVARRGASLR